MANQYYIGTAALVAQTTTVQVTAYDAATTYKLTVGGEVVSTIAAGSANATATALAAAWNASTHVYFTTVTASAATDTVTMIGDTAGVPFVVTSSVSGGAGTIGAASDTVDAAGPNHYDNADNWASGSVPVADDVLYFRHCDVNICWGLDQSAVALDGIYIDQTYTGLVGLDYREFATSADGETTDDSAIEYRGCYLQTQLDSSKHCYIGQHSGPGNPGGSQRLLLDFGDEPALIVIEDTARTSADEYRPAIRLLANDAASTITVRNAPGGVGLATEVPGEASVVSSITIADQTTAAEVYVGDGATVTTYTQYGGNNHLHIEAALTTMTVYGGQLVLDGGQVITTLTIDDDAHVIDKRRYVAAGIQVQVTTCNHNGGTLDLTQHTEVRKYGTYNWKRGAILIVDPDTMTFDTAFVLPSGPSTLTAS